MKGVGPDLTSAQLRRRKVDAVKLAVAFAYATKHYLRGEDGLDWEDYVGVLPASTVQLVRYGVPTRRASTAMSYAATARSSPGGFRTPDDAGSPLNLGDAEVRSPSADATKRIRVKRSKDKLKLPSTKTSHTPLLSERALHQTIDFHPHPETLSTPLPLVIAHELSRLLFLFKRDGYLETVGPAGTNAMSGQCVHGRVLFESWVLRGSQRSDYGRHDDRDGARCQYAHPAVVQYPPQAMCHALPLRASVHAHQGPRLGYGAHRHGRGIYSDGHRRHCGRD